MIKTVIFDMDGLMFDTEKMWVEEGSKLAKTLGYNISANLFLETIGLGNNDAKMVFSKKLGYDFPFEAFRRIYHKRIKQKLRFEPIEEKLGLRELLIYLKNNDYKIAIGSSNTKERINLYLRSANIDSNFFDIIVSGDDVINSKPSPEIYSKIIDCLKELPSNVLILEDSVYGVIAANRAGGHVIVVQDMIEFPKEVEKLADARVNSLMDVISLLNEKNK